MMELTPIQQQVEDRKNAEAAALLKAETDKQYAQDAYKVLDYLLTNAQFLWYVENVLRPMVTDELGRALDISTDRDVRNDAAQRHDFGQGILRAAADKRAFWADKGDIQL